MDWPSFVAGLAAAYGAAFMLLLAAAVATLVFDPDGRKRDQRQRRRADRRDVR